MFNVDKVIRRALLDAAVLLCEAAQDEAPERSGDLKSSIVVGEVTNSGSLYSVTIGIDKSELGGSVNYAPYVHDGTGLYGPKKKRIYPRKSKALNTPFGFKKSIAGQKANPFFDRAFKDNQEKILERFEKVFFGRD